VLDVLTCMAVNREGVDRNLSFFLVKLQLQSIHWQVHQHHVPLIGYAGLPNLVFRISGRSGPNPARP